ncbi:MAG: hypothetical protein M1817_006358 [Caeruleum heppii]|nr:MAG: hypothetical protein M1817_006358 [Caeruleum heppii]
MLSSTLPHALVGCLCILGLTQAQDLPPINENDPIDNSTNVADLPTRFTLSIDRTPSTNVRTALLQPGGGNAAPGVRGSSTEKRQAAASDPFIVDYSTDNISVANNHFLHSVPVFGTELRALLQKAIDVGNAADPTITQSSFNVSLENITMVLTNSNLGSPIFNGQDFAGLAAILLRDTPETGNSLADAWVGTLSRQAGQPVARFAILPTIAVVPASGAAAAPAATVPQSSSAVSSQAAVTASAVAAPNTPAQDGELKMVKRDVYDVIETSLQVAMNVGRHRASSAVLRTLAREALDWVIMQTSIEGLNNVLMFNQRDAANPRSNVFHIAVENAAEVTVGDMIGILETIYGAVVGYTDNALQAQGVAGGRAVIAGAVRTLQGQVINAAGTVLARYFLGGPEGQLNLIASQFICPTVGVVNPDGAVALGCLVGDSITGGI